MKSNLGILLTALCLFQSCGNADKGISLKDQDQLASQTHITVAPNALTNNLGPCKNFNVVTGTNPSYAQVFYGSSICVSLSDRKIVRIRVTANFPRDSMCILPRNNTVQAFSPTCIAIDGQADIVLSTDAYSYIYLISATDLNDMYKYLYGTATYPPPHAILNIP